MISHEWRNISRQCSRRTRRELRTRRYHYIPHGTRTQKYRKIPPRYITIESQSLSHWALPLYPRCHNCMDQGNSHPLCEYLCYHIYRSYIGEVDIWFRYRAGIHPRHHRWDHGVHTVYRTTHRPHPCRDHRTRYLMESRSHHNCPLPHHPAYWERRPRPIRHE